MRVPRAAEAAIRGLAGGHPVIVVTGPRQSGRATPVRWMFGGRSQMYLEDLDEQRHALNNPRGFLHRLPHGAVLDEVERAPDLLSSPGPAWRCSRGRSGRWPDRSARPPHPRPRQGSQSRPHGPPGHPPDDGRLPEHGAVCHRQTPDVELGPIQPWCGSWTSSALASGRPGLWGVR